MSLYIFILTFLLPSYLASEKAKLEQEKKKQIENERNRREKRNQDPVTKIFDL
jgi:hypothetical protein